MKTSIPLTAPITDEPTELNVLQTRRNELRPASAAPCPQPVRDEVAGHRARRISMGAVEFLVPASWEDRSILRFSSRRDEPDPMSLLIVRDELGGRTLAEHARRQSEGLSRRVQDYSLLADRETDAGHRVEHAFTASGGTRVYQLQLYRAVDDEVVCVGASCLMDNLEVRRPTLEAIVQSLLVREDRGEERRTPCAG